MTGPGDAFTSVVPSAQRKLSSSSRRDGRRIFAPADIPAAFETGRRRFEAERPATIEAQRRREQSGNGFVAEASSYFPKIRESQTARDSREQKAKFASSSVVFMDSSATKQRLVPRPSPLATRSSRDARSVVTAPPPRPHSQLSDRAAPSSLVANLDQRGMTSLHEAFERHEHLSEDAFVAEMLRGLEAHKLSRAEQVELTCEISALFRKADVRSADLLNWVDFSTFITQTSDIRTVDEDNTTFKYQVETAPPPLNMTAEIQGMFYFSEVDKILFHDDKQRGFSILDPSTNAIVRGAAHSASGRLVDALYSTFGRYVITATTSPVISLYDMDTLALRQQLPTHAAQLALAMSSDAASTQLFSSCTNGQVHAWDLETLGCSHSFFHRGHPVMNDLLVVDGMAQVAGACLDGKIYMIDLHLHRVTKSLAGHKKAVSMLRYSPENGYLVSAGLDHCVQVWNPHVEQKIGSLTGHRSQLIGMDVVPQTHHILTADDSGVVKIWDLRKFAAVQTVAKELYMKDHSIARTLSRPMTALCYIASKKRVAIAHSTVFFIDQAAVRSASSSDPSSAEDDDTVAPATLELDEAKKPVALFYCAPTQCFVALTCWELKSWDCDSGRLVRTASPVIGSEMTCACLVDDHFSCFVGTESGIVARVMIPNGAVVVQRQVHAAEITATHWLEHKRHVVSSATDGNILITRADSLDVLFKLNHWRGVQSASSAFFHSAVAHTAEYSVPLALRAFFYGNEVERLMRIFGDVDAAQTGSIPLSKLPHVLEAAFPVAFASPTAGDAASDATARTKDTTSSESMITFTNLLEILKDSLTALQDGKGPRFERSLSRVAALDVHSDLSALVTASSSDGTFCAWNVKNGAVLAQGHVGRGPDRGVVSSTSPLSSISHVAFLSPHPYFVCSDAGSSRLELWSAVALPPLLPHSYERFMVFTHRLPARCYPSHPSARDEANTAVFLTETSLNDDDSSDAAAPGESPAAAPKETTIVATAWAGTCGLCATFLVVGDERGFITIYDLARVLCRLEALRHDARAFGSVDTPATVTQETIDPLSVNSVRQLHQWHAHRATAIRSVQVMNIDDLRPSNMLVASATEDGCISLWSVAGELLGRLNDRLRVPRAPRTSAVVWQLRLDASRAKTKAVSQAEQVLERLELNQSWQPQAPALNGRDQLTPSEPSARRSTIGDAPVVKQSPRAVSRLLSLSSSRSPPMLTLDRTRGTVTRTAPN